MVLVAGRASIACLVLGCNVVHVVATAIRTLLVLLYTHALVLQFHTVNQQYTNYKVNLMMFLNNFVYLNYFHNNKDSQK